LRELAPGKRALNVSHSHLVFSYLTHGRNGPGAEQPTIDVLSGQVTEQTVTMKVSPMPNGRPSPKR
jgi:hypothetical protein